MKKTAHLYANQPRAIAETALAPRTSKTSLTRPELVRLFTSWRRDCQIAQHSPATLENTKQIFTLLLWFLDKHSLTICDTESLREFFAYMNADEHTSGSDKGRWDSTIATRKTAGRALRPLTVLTYFGRLRAFFNWIVAQHELDASPLDPIKLPEYRPDQVKPFSHEQIAALLLAARHSLHAKRDTALMLLLLDTGIRVSELCGLKLHDVDTTSKSCTVIGKGNKKRTVYFGKSTAKAIFNYRSEPRNVDLPPDAPLFRSDRGQCYGEALTPSGVRQLIGRLAETAGISDVRASPHTMRHTSALCLLMNGVNAFSLKVILGHTTLATTNRYVNFAQADIEHLQITHSPVDKLRETRRGF